MQGQSPVHAVNDITGHRCELRRHFVLRVVLQLDGNRDGS
jgi:hypothetical protein